MAEDTPKSGNWFTTLPGILTALATLIGAITTLYVAIAAHSKTDTSPQSQPTTTIQEPEKKNSTAAQDTEPIQKSEDKDPTTQEPEKKDPCKDLPFDQRPISCLDEGNK